jgi:Rrf2 family protein
MRISARCNYACKALFELALHWPGGEPLQAHTISKEQDIPMRYLAQILIQLKRSGLVISVMGKDGGYYLSRPPGRISLGEVLRQVGGPLLPVINSAAKKESVFTAIWSEVEDAMAGVLDNITFEDILNKSKKLDRTILYQI